MKHDLILCLGNEILTDDGFGPVVARRLQEGGALPESVEAIFAPVAGFALLDLLVNRERVLIVDTIRTGRAKPGTLYFFTAGILVQGNHLINSHQMSLPTALELGKRLGMPMPTQVDVVAVEVEDVETLSEQLTPRVAAAVSEAVRMAQGWAVGVLEEIDHD